MTPFVRRRQMRQKLHKHLGANLTIFKETFSDNKEMQFREVILGNARHPRKVLLVYCEGMTDSDRLNRDFFPMLTDYFLQLDSRRLTETQLTETLPIHIQATEQFFEPLVPQILRGLLVICIDGIDAAFVIDLSNRPNRQPEEPANEMSIRGPRDGFVEDSTVNIALVRKRLPTESLCSESFTIGVRSQTKVSVLYIRDIIDPSILTQLRERLNRIWVDAVWASSQLEEFLSDSKFYIVPLFAYSGRPDFVVSALVRGRFVIIMDGVPTVLIGPGNLSLMLQAAEDEYVPYPFLIAQRGLRLMGLLITVLLPGFYIAITTYHQEQIPLVLLGTLVTSRRGTPFPTPMEAIIMLTLFELLREAGNRLPGSLGQSLAVVGGLIIGQAAIDAGLTSAIMLALIGVSGIAVYTIPNQSLAGILALFRLFIIIVSSFLGEFGFLIASFSVLVYLSTVRSFGVPYLAPFSPFRARDLTYTFTSGTAYARRKRPTILRTKDKTRQ